MKKFSIGIILTACLIFQFTIPLFIRENEEYILTEGTVYRFNVNKIENDYKNGLLYLEIETRPRSQSIITEENGINMITQEDEYIYEIFTNINGKSYLNPVLKAYIGDSDYLKDNNVIYEVRYVPNDYISNDKIKTLTYGTSGTKYFQLVAEVVIKNEAYIVTNVYVNGVPYFEYVNEHFYELLE